jgi:hypothetical protein
MNEIGQGFQRNTAEDLPYGQAAFTLYPSVSGTWSGNRIE